MLDAVRRDFSFTSRSLRRAPTFSVTVVLILGLAIGMSSAMLTVFRSVLLERLPVKQQDRIVELSGLAGGAASEVPISPAQVRRFREQSRTVNGVAALAHWRVIGEALVDGDRRLSLREAVVTDKSLARNVKVRAKAEAADPMQVGAPIPGMVTALSATVGGKVAKGDKIATLEAMKMQTNILAPADGIIAEVQVSVGDSVEAGDLVVKLRS